MARVYADMENECTLYLNVGALAEEIREAVDGIGGETERAKIVYLTRTERSRMAELFGD